ncbi:acyltransferase family protein [Thalassotalea sp. G2M2-11]|uniref:SGNH hydrolase domain-containing protein n=1 Tax=Thalassotalea sp. G2M2-11 TaxID=2787627 RepID=UPI0019CF51CB
MNYRSDIDGLRTIAVFLVILNHAGFSLFSGGYVGVDVFFVISGFLITSIIYPKIVEKNFSIGWFLSRRIKRLMPVLFFIIFIIAIVFSLIMLPQDLVKFYQSIIWVILYAGNFFMWIHHGGYFDGNSQEAPLLHTWSLAVEEQYYFVWPIMLIIAVRLFGVKVTAWLSIFLFVAMTVFSQWGTEVTIGAAYYLLPTRFFELLLGSCVAIFWHKRPKLNEVSHHFISLLGLALIIVSAVALSEHSPFPGYNALYPTVGTALLIYSQYGVVNRFLRTKAMVYSGNISYSLYLWHWPIFTLLRYLSIELSLLIQILAIVLTYVLSVLSYHYIEQPCRKSRINSFSPIAIKFYVVPTVLIVSIALFGIYQKGYESRFDGQTLKMEQALNTHSSDSRKVCHSAFRDYNRKPSEDCIIGERQANSKGVLIIGDSHANHLVPFISELLSTASAWGQDYTLDRCLPIVGLNWGGNLYKAERCRARNEMILRHIRENAFSYVVLAASWPDETTRRMFDDNKQLTSEHEKIAVFQNKLQKTVEEIINSGAVPVLFEDTPTLEGKSPKCPIKQKIYNESLNCDINLKTNEFISKAFRIVKSIYPETIIIRPSELYCKEGSCSMSLNNIPLYRDDDHLNVVGAKELAKQYLNHHSNFIR